MAVNISVGYIEETYLDLLDHLLSHGVEVSPRGLKTKTLRNVTMVFSDTDDILLTGLAGRKMAPQLGALEALQLVGGFTDPELTVAVVPHYANFRSEDMTFHGAYGSRTGPWMEHVVRRLMVDSATRQAVVNFWDNAQDLPNDGLRDYPCTLSSAFEIDEHGALCGTTIMRSNDAWLGFPYDIIQHTSLLKSLAAFLGVPVGTYTHQVHNFHLYESNWKQAGDLLDEFEPGSAEVQPRLSGGIGAGAEAWDAVQLRAKKICYTPEKVTPATDEEAWMIEQAKKWRKHVL